MTSRALNSQGNTTSDIPEATGYQLNSEQDYTPQIDDFPQNMAIFE